MVQRPTRNFNKRYTSDVYPERGGEELPHPVGVVDGRERVFTQRITEICLGFWVVSVYLIFMGKNRYLY